MENENKRITNDEIIEILTPSGFQKFDGVKRYWHDKSLKFIFEDESFLETALDHRFIVEDKEIFAKDVTVGQNIGKIVKDIILIKVGDYFYDPINVSNGSIYCHDQSFISHNSFIGSGDTLIDAEYLLKLKSKPYVKRTSDEVKIYKEPVSGHQYIMSVDVAKGRGQDYSTFNVIDISTNPFQQVAVYRNNLISPLLFPNIIYKYANSYNRATVVVESNDAGQVVCNGLYHELEYENLFVESTVKANSLGLLMTRKVKRIGCSSFKDLVENFKIDISDEDTIREISTFVARGQSFEASPGNHDDLVMNLILFSYFVSTGYFGELTDINIKQLMFENRMREIEEDILPFGFIDDGINHPNPEVIQEDGWGIVGERMF